MYVNFFSIFYIFESTVFEKKFATITVKFAQSPEKFFSLT